MCVRQSGQSVAGASSGRAWKMAANKAKKVTKMATKACPECDQQIPVACKSCPCGFIFISRRLLNAKQSEKSPPSTLENKSEAKRRRTERARREKVNSPVTKDMENRKRSRSESHSEQYRRRRGRPKTTPSKKHDDDKDMSQCLISVASSSLTPSMLRKMGHRTWRRIIICRENDSARSHCRLNTVKHLY
ncbi:UPF0547 protein C16orf87 homolog isoform X1 [Callorhinchus milii]|uniref:UPF0547 protein C16orf87 homolog isoform X1 n=1 Tax=Callorhinchus milii TaxID=7868 RepID=UPI001C3FDD76|nr:UPF0547 protein C16orf87 homolog isoform X1 [Callorhinchus milii]